MVLHDRAVRVPVCINFATVINFNDIGHIEQEILLQFAKGMVSAVTHTAVHVVFFSSPRSLSCILSDN